MLSTTTTLSPPLEQVLAPPSAVRYAVIYLRVSTTEQAHKGGLSEGFSIPAQRDMSTRAAHRMGAFVVKEFIDSGRSGTSVNRPGLQRMLEYIEEPRVDYVIVHKLDRLARNRADDSDINARIQRSGATLVSCSESIDPSPGGQLVHGIMASIAEFYSRNLAAEVNKGVIQKLRNGGTPCRAPLGYRNIRVIGSDGREYRCVEVDEQKAAMIRWAFHTYAAGNTTLSQITTSLNLLGLRSRTIGGKEGPGMSVSMTQRMLRHPYYKGIIVWRGVDYPGTHAPLVDPDVWQQVQDRLATNRIGKGARKRHPHHLSGILKCGHCGASMVASHSRSRSGKIYPYFICNGRNNKTTDCTMRATPIAAVEELVEELYAQITLTPEEAENERAKLTARVGRPSPTVLKAEREEHRRELERQQQLVLDAYYQDAISLEMLRSEQQRIRDELREVDAGTPQSRDDATDVARLNMRENLHSVYRDADLDGKQAMHRTMFGHLVLVRGSSNNLLLTSRPIQILERS